MTSGDDVSVHVLQNATVPLLDQSSVLSLCLSVIKPTQRASAGPTLTDLAVNSAW